MVKIPHEPLCAMPTEAVCIGCLLVELRSDAAHGSVAERAEAYVKLIALRDLVGAHIADIEGA